MITVVGAFASITGDVMAAVESRVMPNEPNTMVNPAKTSSIVVIAFANLSFCSKAFYNLLTCVCVKAIRSSPVRSSAFNLMII